MAIQAAARKSSSATERKMLHSFGRRWGRGDFWLDHATDDMVSRRPARRAWGLGEIRRLDARAATTNRARPSAATLRMPRE